MSSTDRTHSRAPSSTLPKLDMFKTRANQGVEIVNYEGKPYMFALKPQADATTDKVTSRGNRNAKHLEIKALVRKTFKQSNQPTEDLSGRQHGYKIGEWLNFKADALREKRNGTLELLLKPHLRPAPVSHASMHAFVRSSNTDLEHQGLEYENNQLAGSLTDRGHQLRSPTDKEYSAERPVSDSKRYAASPSKRIMLKKLAIDGGIEVSTDDHAPETSNRKFQEFPKLSHPVVRYKGKSNSPDQWFDRRSLLKPSPRNLDATYITSTNFKQVISNVSNKATIKKPFLAMSLLDGSPRPRERNYCVRERSAASNFGLTGSKSSRPYRRAPNVMGKSQEDSEKTQAYLRLLSKKEHLIRSLIFTRKSELDILKKSRRLYELGTQKNLLEVEMLEIDEFQIEQIVLLARKQRREDLILKIKQLEAEKLLREIEEKERGTGSKPTLEARCIPGLSVKVEREDGKPLYSITQDSQSSNQLKKTSFAIDRNSIELPSKEQEAMVKVFSKEMSLRGGNVHPHINRQPTDQTERQMAAVLSQGSDVSPIPNKQANIESYSSFGEGSFVVKHLQTKDSRDPRSRMQVLPEKDSSGTKPSAIVQYQRMPTEPITRKKADEDLRAFEHESPQSLKKELRTYGANKSNLDSLATIKPHPIPRQTPAEKLFMANGLHDGDEQYNRIVLTNSLHKASESILKQPKRYLSPPQINVIQDVNESQDQIIDDKVKSEFRLKVKANEAQERMPEDRVTPTTSQVRRIRKRLEEEIHDIRPNNTQSEKFKHMKPLSKAILVNGKKNLIESIPPSSLQMTCFWEVNNIPYLEGSLPPRSSAFQIDLGKSRQLGRLESISESVQHPPSQPGGIQSSNQDIRFLEAEESVSRGKSRDRSAARASSGYRLPNKTSVNQLLGVIQTPSIMARKFHETKQPEIQFLEDRSSNSHSRQIKRSDQSLTSSRHINYEKSYNRMDESRSKSIEKQLGRAQPWLQKVAEALQNNKPINDQAKDTGKGELVRDGPETSVVNSKIQLKKLEIKEVKTEEERAAQSLNDLPKLTPLATKGFFKAVVHGIYSMILDGKENSPLDAGSHPKFIKKAKSLPSSFKYRQAKKKFLVEHSRGSSSSSSVQDIEEKVMDTDRKSITNMSASIKRKILPDKPAAPADGNRWTLRRDGTLLQVEDGEESDHSMGKLDKTAAKPLWWESFHPGMAMKRASAEFSEYNRQVSYNAKNDNSQIFRPDVPNRGWAKKGTNETSNSRYHSSRSASHRLTEYEFISGGSSIKY